jgi:hypothetical protein
MRRCCCPISQYHCMLSPNISKSVKRQHHNRFALVKSNIHGSPGNRRQTMAHSLATATAPSSKGKITCTCGRSFKTNRALQQHQRDSPFHPDRVRPSIEEVYPLTGTTGDTPAAWRGEQIAEDLRKREMFTEPRQYANFRNEESFPTFAGLPGDNDINLAFYNTTDGYHYTPRKHWCFLAEITDIEQFLRVKLTVRDKAGATVPVAFHTDGRGTEFAQLQPRHTIAILYAQQHGFLDLTTGIRQEEYNGIKVGLSNA